MSLSVSGLDHVIIGARDLEATLPGWARLGFTLTPRGRHREWGTANYCVMFPKDYLELLGIVDPSKFTNNLDKFLAIREGALGLAFLTAEADSVKTELTELGIDADGPKDLSRILELPEGDVEPSFKLVFLNGATPNLNSFVCQHLTPDMLRRPEWLTHANGATGLQSVTIVAEQPESLAGAYEKLFGKAAVIVADHTLIVKTGGHELNFIAPDDLGTFHSQSDKSNIQAPYIAAITLAVPEVAQTQKFFDEAGVSAQRVDEHTVAVGEKDANGVMIEFTEE
jgi:Glyoxalase-like domain